MCLYPSKSVERAYLDSLVQDESGSSGDDDDDDNDSCILSHIPSSVKDFMSTYSL